MCDSHSTSLWTPTGRRRRAAAAARAAAQEHARAAAGASARQEVSEVVLHFIASVTAQNTTHVSEFYCQTLSERV